MVTYLSKGTILPFFNFPYFGKIEGGGGAHEIALLLVSLYIFFFSSLVAFCSVTSSPFFLSRSSGQEGFLFRIREVSWLYLGSGLGYFDRTL
jgi:hypothetical protein